VRGPVYLRLLAHARRYAGAADAEDVLQEALIAALRDGRDDLTDTGNIRWLRGVIPQQGEDAPAEHLACAPPGWRVADGRH
jgi:hypothetical protein